MAFSALTRRTVLAARQLKPATMAAACLVAGNAPINGRGITAQPSEGVDLI